MTDKVLVGFEGGEVERLDTLAARINAEYRACHRAVTAALEHAMDAGTLLWEAKGACPHGKWTAWLRRNFKGSERTAQDYMRLASHRAEIEEAKAQRAADLSIRAALDALRGPPLPPPPKGARPDPLVLRQLQREREFAEAWERIGHEVVRAATQARKGDPRQPADVKVSAEEWRKAYTVAEEQRIWEAGNKLRPVAEGLHEFLHPRRGYRVHMLFRVTINANGELAVLRDRTTAECK